MPDRRRTVAEVGTRLRTTYLVEDAGGSVVEHEWLMPWPSILEHPGLDAARTLLANGPLALPERGEGGRLTYRVPGLLTLAGAVSRAPELAPALLTRLGGALAALRAVSRSRPDLVAQLPGGASPRVATMARALRAPDGPTDVLAFAGAVRAALSTAGDAALEAHLDRLTRPGPDDVLVHGELSLGNSFFAAGAADVVVVGGDGICRGPAAADVAWVLGELHELRVVHAPGSETLDADVLAGLEATFLEASGLRGADAQLAQALVATRLLVHAHDYAAYVGWRPDVAALCDAAAEILNKSA